jgi:hypothetical protein
MTDGYELTPSDLVAHARDVEIFAGNVRSAKAKAANTEAYGLVGMVWSWAMAEWCEDAHAFVDKAALKAEDVAANLVLMAETYANQEQANADSFRRAGGDGP